MSAATDDEFAEILKQTDAILTEARLSKIAKENKSIGAILDQRTLYNIEEVHVRTKKSIQQEIDKRIHSRRGGRGERDIKPQAALVLESFREKGVHIDLLSGNYDLELNMWKNNARKSIHQEQRKYKHPELHNFLVQMDAKQRSLYKERIGARLIRIAEELRDECRTIKSEMDLNGIFHPEANSHRVHCMYIMKLHKRITPEHIEDAILDKMYQEAMFKQRSEEEIAQKKEQMLQNIALEEEKKKRRRGRLYDPSSSQPSTSSADASGSQAQPVPASGPAAATATATGAASKGGAPPGKAGAAATTKKTLGPLVAPPNLHSKSLPPSRGGSFSSPSRAKSSGVPSSSSNPKLHSSASAKVITTSLDLAGKPSSSQHDEQHVHPGSKPLISKSKSANSISNPVNTSPGRRKDLKSRDAAAGVAAGGSIDGSAESSLNHPSPDRRHNSPLKIFNKLSRPDRLGFMDSGSLLKEEAARFASTETILTRKPRDKNFILEERISQWMLHGIQQQQIEKAATRSTTIVPNDSNVWAASADRVASLPIAPYSSTNYSPSRVLPFDDYYKLLREVDASLGDSPPTRAGQLAGSANNSPPSSPTRSIGPTGEPLKASMKSASFHEDPHLATAISLEGLALGGANTPSANAAAGHHGASSHSTSLQASAANSTDGAKSFAPLNLIKHFTENDKNFDAYLKISELEQPSAKLFAKLSGNKAFKQKKMRRAVPLGKDAVHLVDSRGKASRLANKGFVNVFRVQAKKSRQKATGAGGTGSGGQHRGGGGNGGGGGDDDSDSSTSSSSEEDDENSSAIQRLDGLEVEDDNRSSDSSTGANRQGRRRGTTRRGTSAEGRRPGSNGDERREDLSSPSPSGPLPRDYSRRSIAQSRSRRRIGHTDSSLSLSSPLTPSTNRSKGSHEFFEDNLDELLYPSLAEGEVDLQSKLQVTWDALNMAAMDRLGFMTKYSTQAYASEMSRAIDLWSDAAVCLVIFREMLILRQRMQSNALAVSSTKPKDMLADIFRKIPPLLACKSPALVPISAVYDRVGGAVSEPLSATTVVQLRQMVKDFVVNITTNNTTVNDPGLDQAAEIALLQKKATLISREIGMMASQRLEQVNNTLSDAIHFNGKNAKDWLLAQEVMKIVDTEL